MIENGSSELADLTEQSEKLRHLIKAKQGRIKKLKAGKEKKYSPERVQSELKKTESELKKFEAERDAILNQLRRFISKA